MSGLNLTLKIWRQKDAKTKGQFETVKINDVSPDMSFLEMLDIVNEEQMKQGKEGFAFDHDCREGICGMCSLVINGMPHGPDDHHLPASHAQVQGWRHHRDRTVARRRIPGYP